MFQYIKSTFSNSFKAKSIPSLDGIRAISALFVIIGHFSYLYLGFFENYFGKILGPTIAYSIGNQYTGVSFFFVLSGFLITNLLIIEHEKSGTINYKQFFFKRVFRIFPAFYFYALIIFLFLKKSAILAYSNQDIWASLTYTHNYFSDLNPWHIGHFWSLSLEEQFYLFWPILFLLFHKRLGKKLSLGVILLSPAIRLITYFLFVEWRGRISIMTHTRLDSLLFGAYLAYLYREGQFQKLYKKIEKYKLQYLFLFQILFLSRLLQTIFQGKYILLLGFSLDAFSMCGLIIYAINSKDRLVRFLNYPFVIHLGTLSYGLYLWQMPFVWSAYKSDYLALRIFLIYVMANISYIFIETPFMKLRDKLLKH